MTSLVRGSVRVAMAVRCVAQHATPRSTAQHTCELEHNATTGVTHIPSIVLAAIGGQLEQHVKDNLYNLVELGLVN